MGVDWALAVATRNINIHQYDDVDREQTWLTLSVDRRAWHASLRPLISEARAHDTPPAGSPRLESGP